jgi:tight adherence protein C
MTSINLLLLFLLFVGVVGALLGVTSLLFRSKDMQTRLDTVVAASSPNVSNGYLNSNSKNEGVSSWRAWIGPLFSPFSRLAASEDSADVGRFKIKFLQAGYRSSGAPAIFFGAKAVLTFVLPAIAFGFIRSSSLKFPTTSVMAIMLVFAAIGYYLPSIFLANRRANRQREIFEAFPDATDLMLVCVEAGLGLDAAIARCAKEITLRSEVLAQELNLVALELRVGASRDRALRNLAARTGVEEVSSFSAMIVQADRFGTSIADSLRVMADMLRVKRRMRAEEQAAKIPLKLLLPLIFCIFPALLTVLMGPAAIQIYRVLLPAMAGK